MRARLALGVVALSVSCGGAATEHETLGDRGYSALEFAEAHVEYRLALVQDADNPSLLAKAGSAALHAGNLEDAAEAYVGLSEFGTGDRLTEASDGLERVAQAALESGDREALTAALSA